LRAMTLLPASIFLFIVPTVALAQVAQPVSNVQLLKNPIEILKENEPPLNTPYQLSPGDQIEVEVVGRAALSGKHTIGPDGLITLPVVGSVDLLHKTRDQAAKAIEDKLADYYTDVSVSVGVDTYVGNGVTLLGAVQHPGFIQTNGPPELLDVLSKGGMLPQTAVSNGPAAPIGVAGYPEECVIYRGQDKVFKVELRQLLEENNNLGNYRLMSGDTIYVPGTHKYVSILGQVKIPGQAALTSDSTLTDIVARAGGLMPGAGSNPTIQIIHPSDGRNPGKIQLVSFNNVKAAKPIDVTLQSGDVIFVPESGFTRFGNALEKISPLVNLVEVGAILR
jgi:polysaccharide export outer membrane protein